MENCLRMRFKCEKKKTKTNNQYDISARKSIGLYPVLADNSDNSYKNK